jgi:hypothetical protein
MSLDDFGSLPPDDPFETEGGLDSTAEDPGLDTEDPAAGGDPPASGADDGVDAGAELESLFGAGGALELSSDPAGDQELARWLDEPAPPARDEELTDFAERLGRRFRGE